MTETNTPPDERRPGGLTDIHIAVFIFGFSGLFGKLLSCSPWVIVLGRTFFAFCALYPLLGHLSLNPFQVSRRHLWAFMLQGGLLGFHWTAFFHAIQISSVAIGLLTFSTFPVFVTFMEPLFFKERLTPGDVTAAFVVFLGLALVLPSPDLSLKPVQGAFWGTISGFTFAILALVNRKTVTRSHPMTVAFYQNLFACLTLAPIVLFMQPGFPSLHDSLLLAVLGIICTALAHTMFIRSLVRIKARTAAVITGLEPLYGIIFAFFLLHETPGPRVLAGGVLILSATTLAGRLHKKNAP